LVAETLLLEALVAETLLLEALVAETLLLEALVAETLLLEALVSETLLEALVAEALLLEALLLQTLLAEPLLERVVALVDHLVGMDGGLAEVLGDVLFCTLNHGDHPLAMDDGLNLVNDVGMNLMLDNRLILDDAALAGSRFVDMLLDVMDDVVVYRAVENRLHFHHAVVPHCLLHDGSK